MRVSNRTRFPHLAQQVLERPGSAGPARASRHGARPPGLRQCFAVHHLHSARVGTRKDVSRRSADADKFAGSEACGRLTGRARPAGNPHTKRRQPFPGGHCHNRLAFRRQRRRSRIDFMSNHPPTMLPQNTPVTGAQVASAILGERSAIVLDVGARWGAEKAWWRLSPLAKLIGFEPDASECARLNALHGDCRTDEYIPLALSDSCGPATLYVTSEPACSSLYPPDERLVDRYPDLACIRPEREVSVSGVTLDAWIDTRPETFDAIAFMKVDVQGAELKILRGASHALEKCAGIEVEVEFNPIYRGQPLFGEVDALLRSAGFSLWRLSDLCHYAESCEGRPRGLGTTHYGGLDAVFEEGDGRLYWANALYLRDYADLPLDGGFIRTSLWLTALMEARRDLAGAYACLERLLRLATNLGDAERHAIRNHQAAMSSRQATHRTRKALKDEINRLAQENTRLRAELAGKRAWPKF